MRLEPAERVGHHRRHRLRRRRAGAPARSAPERRGRSRSRAADRADEPIAKSHPHLATDRAHGRRPPAGRPDAVFLGLPHGAAAALVPDLLAQGVAVIDLGPDFRLRDPADYPRWYRFEHPAPELLGTAVYGLPELHRAELAALRDAADAASWRSPGCYPTATILALAPLARAGLDR